MIVKNMKKYFTFEVQVRFNTLLWSVDTFETGSNISVDRVNLSDSWRQRSETEIPCFEFPVEYKSETIHMHYANEIGWGMESGYSFSLFSIDLEERYFFHFYVSILQVQFNLADFCRRAYGSNYVETLRIQVRITFYYLH